MFCFQAEGWNWGSHGQSSLLAGCHSDPEQFMISASVSLGVPEASPCLAHQGCHPGDGQKEGSSGQRALSKWLSGILLLCHPSSSPPWMVRGGLGPRSLIGTPDAAQPPRAQSTVTVKLVGKGQLLAESQAPHTLRAWKLEVAERKWGLRVCSPCPMV